MASTQNNSKDINENVNTRGINFYNKDGFDPSAMSLGFWNETFLTININPTLEKSKQTQTRIYDYERTVSTALSVNLLQVLSHGIRTHILPAIKSGENKTFGIQVAGDSLVAIGTGVKQTGSVRPFIAIHKGLNPSTKIPEMSIHYEFNRAQIINDYDAQTGDYTLEDNIHHELMIFTAIIEHAISALSKADVHAMRTVMKYYNNKLMNSVTAIGNKVGADMPGNNRSFVGGTRIDFSNHSSSSSNDEPIEYGNLDSINEMLG